MKRIGTILLLALLATGSGLLGVAQNAATIYSIEPGVSLLGAGGAGVSVINGSETIYYNAAGLSELPGISFSSFYASYLGLANYSSLALTFRNWGIAAMTLGSGGIQGYDATGNPTETLAFRNSAIVFGIGMDPSDLPFIPTMGFDFSVGVKIKLLSASIGATDGSGFGLDLGFRTTFGELGLGGLSISDVALGLSLVNLLGGVTYDAQSDNLGTDIQLGFSARIAGALLVALDIHVGGGSIHAGVAYSPIPTLSLRAGMIAAGTTSFTLGLGVDVQGFLLDYAYVSHSLGGSHRVSLTLDFSSLDIAALSRSLRNILP